MPELHEVQQKNLRKEFGTSENYYQYSTCQIRVDIDQYVT